ESAIPVWVQDPAFVVDPDNVALLDLRRGRFGVGLLRMGRLRRRLALLRGLCAGLRHGTLSPRHSPWSRVPDLRRSFLEANRLRDPLVAVPDRDLRDARDLG